MFKAFGRALRMAVETDPRLGVCCLRPRVVYSRYEQHCSSRLRHGQPALGGEGAGACGAGCAHRGDQRSPARLRRPTAWCSPASARCRTACANWSARGLRQAAGRGGADQAVPGYLPGHAGAVRISAKKAMPPAWACLPGQVRLFPAEAMDDDQGQRLKVPHMGWNEVHQTAAHPLWAGIPTARAFISCTVITSRRAIPTWWRRLPFIRLHSPGGGARIIFSPCNSTRKKARPRV